MRRVASMLITSAALFGFVGAAGAIGPGYGPDDPSRITNMKSSPQTTDQEIDEQPATNQGATSTGSGTGGYSPDTRMSPGSTGSTGTGTGSGAGGVGCEQGGAGTGAGH